MNIDSGQVFESTQVYFDFLYKTFKKNRPLSEADILNAKESNYEANLITYLPDMLTLAATAGIWAYHNLLRKKLLENGIDIGEME